jgi:peptide deformylase
MDCGEEHGGLIELVNPEIAETSGEQLGPEGCLSIPNIQGDVLRPLHVTVKAQNRHGEPIEIEGTELLARCIMHEVDHLNGVLFTDIAQTVYRTDADGSGVKAE